MSEKVQEFVLVTDVPDFDDLPLAALIEAGCDDAAPAFANGVTYIPFFRVAESQDEAIQSATRDVMSAFQSAGLPYRVVMVANIEFNPFAATSPAASTGQAS